jgi:hypothetical protein
MFGIMRKEDDGFGLKDLDLIFRTRYLYCLEATKK